MQRVSEWNYEQIVLRMWVGYMWKGLISVFGVTMANKTMNMVLALIIAKLQCILCI